MFANISRENSLQNMIKFYNYICLIIRVYRVRCTVRFELCALFGFCFPCFFAFLISRFSALRTFTCFL